MRPFIVNEAILARIDEVIKYAEGNIYSLEMHMGIATGKYKPPGDYIAYNVVFPFGYRVVFSIMETDKGLYRVVSASVPGEGKFPSVHVFGEIIKLFKFREDMDALGAIGAIRFDNDLSGKPVAVLALEKYLPDGHNQHSEASAGAGQKED